ncbi:MAG: hypothetical protein HZB33_01090 [Nitrospirae bacterium]|nr:hypothetical protein [Nitrospirota bacterium]
MKGQKLYPKKSRVYFFLFMYGMLAVAGAALATNAISLGQGPKGASGFMIVFGAGMFIMTAAKSMRPQVSVFEDYLQIDQTRKPQLVRYRYLVACSRPDGNRLVITVREEGVRRDVTIWTKELNEDDVSNLADFLSKKAPRSK